jgi:anti-sigma factor RsiW
MTGCENIRESIGRWLDGELSPAESEAAREHVLACAACGETRRQLEKIDATLKSVLAAEAARVEFTPFWRDVQSRVNRKRAWYADWLDWSRGLLAGPRVAWAVPTVIALLLGLFSLDSYWLGWRFGGSRNSFAAVDSIDAHGRSVALLRENETKTTVIWLYEDQEGENETAEEASKSGPAF